MIKRSYDQEIMLSKDDVIKIACVTDLMRIMIPLLLQVQLQLLTAEAYRDTDISTISVQPSNTG